MINGIRKRGNVRNKYVRESDKGEKKDIKHDKKKENKQRGENRKNRH